MRYDLTVESKLMGPESRMVVSGGWVNGGKLVKGYKHSVIK